MARVDIGIATIDAAVAPDGCVFRPHGVHFEFASPRSTSCGRRHRFLLPSGCGMSDIGIPSEWQAAELYCAIAFAASLLTFLVFRIREGIAHHFSVHDALEVAKAVVVAELLTILVTFSTVRMDGIPRSLPALHALILAAGLIGYRLFVRMRYDERVRVKVPDAHAENIIIIGATRLSSLYARMMKAYSPHKHKIVAILDSDPKMIGKAVDGIRVVGAPEQLELHRFRNLASTASSSDACSSAATQSFLDAQEMDAVERTCSDYNLTPEFIPSLAGLDNVQEASADQPEEVPPSDAVVRLPAYFRYKRAADMVHRFVFARRVSCRSCCWWRRSFCLTSARRFFSGSSVLASAVGPSC